VAGSIPVEKRGIMTACCAHILIEVGYWGGTACGWREALDCLEEDRFDLLLTELKMSQVDGLAVLLRARELYPELAAILMTSDAALGYRVGRCGEIGARIEYSEPATAGGGGHCWSVGGV